MADHEDKAWDEYDWERFLQQQEQRTERYIDLLEKYLDHPQRDEIIAKEMGWSHLIGGDSREWEEEVDAKFEQEFTEIEQGADGDEAAAKEGDGGFHYESHPLYRETVAFVMELEDIFHDTPSNTARPPRRTVRVSTSRCMGGMLGAGQNETRAVTSAMHAWKDRTFSPLGG